MNNKYQNLNKKKFSSHSTSIMDDVENNNNNIVITPQLILLRSIRKNIENQMNDLKFRAKIFNFLDWFLFIIGIICMGLTGMRVDFPISKEITLIQLFGIIALFSKVIERGLNMTKIAKNTIVAAKMMEALLREIVLIEIQFLDPNVDPVALMKTVKQEIDTIWETFSELGLETFIQPDIAEQASSGQRNLNISINMAELNKQQTNEKFSIKVDSNDNVDISGENKI